MINFDDKEKIISDFNELKNACESERRIISKLKKELAEQTTKAEVYKRDAENLERTLEEAGERIEELEQQFAYECECNKQFVECQNKVEELEQQLKELPKKICDEIEELGNQGDFIEISQSKLDKIRTRYTKEQTND